MKTISWFCILFIILALLEAAYGAVPGMEKVEEGRYGLVRNGGLVAGSEHSWTLWRLPDGQFALEDHFQVDRTAQVMSAILLSPDLRTSPAFRKSLQEGIQPSDLSAVFASDGSLVSLTVSGVNVNNDPGVGLKCKDTSNRIECAGTSDKATLRVHEACGLFWWYGVPMLLRPWLAPVQESSSGNGPQRIALLSFGVIPKTRSVTIRMKAEPGAKISWGDKPELEPADLTISSLGMDTLVLGDKRFRTQKHKLEVKVAKGDPISLTTWTDANGTILAVEDGADPGALIALLQYKSYAIPPATPAAK